MLKCKINGQEVEVKEGSTITKWKTFTGAKGIDNFTDAIEQFLAIKK